MSKKKFTAIVCKWFDRINGNTYHSVRIVRHRDGAVICAPFQYGYGSQYEQSTTDALFEAGWLSSYRREVLATADNPEKFAMTRYTKATASLFQREKNYPIIYTVSDGLKRDCVANGEI